MNALIAATRAEPSEMEKLLSKPNPYKWEDVDCVVEVVEGIEKLESLSWSRIVEYLRQSPTGRAVLKETNFKQLAKQFTALAEKLEGLK